MAQKRNERKLTIWSAASSTGQEAYSLAMMLCEHFPELAAWDVKIIATDISQQAREYARFVADLRAVARELPEITKAA